jgi:cellulose synthase/poly-beta-1,6-N-acetylglucosamine synthase-like glycosyltransferase
MIVGGLLLALAGGVAAAFGLYLILLAFASFRYSQSIEAFSPRSRLVVLIPAHDEELLVSRTVRSLLAQSYPRELFQIAVIADNCTDRTAAVSADAGADMVMVRDAPDSRGKGRALQWAIDQILSAEEPPDAIVSVDADTITDPDLLLALVERLEGGALAVQSDYRAIGDGSESAALREAGFLLFNRVRPAGCNVLGRSAWLVGNGWLLSTVVLRRRPWAAFTSTEDREYSLDLQSDGVRIAFAGAAAVHAPTAPSHQAAQTQQLRWEGGWASLLRARLPRLLRDAWHRRSLDPLIVAFELAVPPLGLLAAGALGGLLVSAVLSLAGLWSGWLAVPWIVASVSVPLYVVIGFIASGAPRSTYRALLHAPLFVLAKPLSLRRTLGFRGDTWVRTERTSDSRP